MFFIYYITYSGEMASDKGFGSYSGMPVDKILFSPGTRYGIMP
jgi:hypothetical protein